MELDSDDVEWIGSTEGLSVPSLPDVVSPHESGICSGGSTGTPKVILRSTPSIYVSDIAVPFAAEWMEVRVPETILVPTALYHGNGFNGIRNLLGGNEVLILEKFDAARVVDVIERYHVTNFTATPTMLQRIADLPWGRRAQSVESGVDPSGSGPYAAVTGPPLGFANRPGARVPLLRHVGGAWVDR